LYTVIWPDKATESVCSIAGQVYRSIGFRTASVFLERLIRLAPEIPSDMENWSAMVIR